MDVGPVVKRVQDLLRMDGRVALVTGGAGHLATAIGEALAEAGATLVLTDARVAEAERSAEALRRALGATVSVVPGDLSDARAGPEVVRRVVEEHGRLDVLVNNAAFTGTTPLPGWAVPFDRQSVEAWEAALRVNLTAPFVLAQAAREPLARSGHGVVLNVGSIYGAVGPDARLYEGTAMGNPAAYGASKAGLAGLTRYLATVLAPEIRVNCLSPGGIERGQPESFRRAYEARTPLRRMATEEDVKGAVLFLASDASRYVTGQELLVDGGWTAW